MRTRTPIPATFQRALAALVCCLPLLPCTLAKAVDILVSNAFEISAAMQNAMPGDTLVMANGTWTDERISFAGNGVAGNPITLRAETPGGVLLNGNSKLSISGDWLVADGLNFDGGALTEGQHVVEFRGSNGEATNSRFTNSTIANYNPDDINTRYFWVSMYGEANRVDNNYFANQNHSGVTVTVWRGDDGPDNHQIDRNYFADRPVGNGNGWETIRIGTSDESLSNSFTVVENNLFERTDGEVEIISNKSGSNIFRYNTFRDAAGTLTLRHGDNNRVEGNFFLGQGRDGSGGVRVIGERQTLINNYFQDLDGRAGGAISISAGVPDSPLNEYYQVKDTVIAHNTIVNVKEAAITFDDGLGSSGRSLLAENVTVANNLIWSTQDSLFEGNEGVGWLWEGNLAFGQSLGPKAGDPGIAVVDPQLSAATGGIFRPAANSPVVDAGAGSYSGLFNDDMDGQPRVGIFDVGADEVSMSTIVRMPLMAGDVGPDWLSGNNPQPPIGGGGGGCSGQGCAIQAEDFSAILDPDNDGNTWAVESVTSALGGEVLKAPAGDRVDLPAEPHDSIATYTLEFETAGVYTAYYRARGFDGSSDSLFTADDFGVDPDNNESLSSNGTFRWEKDSRTFTITQSHVGVPLEYRIGMREQDSELDALVLNLNGELSDQALDELFALLPGDYNNDGLVNLADFMVWRDTLGSVGNGLAADGNGSGAVDGGDYDVWKQHFGTPTAASAVIDTAAAVPEPNTFVLILATFVGWTCLKSERFRRQVTCNEHGSRAPQAKKIFYPRSICHA